MVRRIVFAFAMFGLLASLPGEPSISHAAPPAPTISSEILDTADTAISDDSVLGGTAIHVSATVGGSGPMLSGAVSFGRYATASCAGSPASLPLGSVTTASQQVFRTADISNTAGWDSATAWNANGADQLDTNWFGGLFAGNDNAFFASSSMAWRFTSIPLHLNDTINDAYLSLRIRQSRPNLPSEGTWTWKTVLAADTRDGSDFQGETRATFRQRLGTWGAFWDIPLSSADVDPFDTDDGAQYAASPDVTSLVQGRISGPSWAFDGNIVIGVLNRGTSGIAEAEVVDEPDAVRLHIEWTSTVHVQDADSGTFVPAPGVQSYRAQYAGDGYYGPADGPCMSLSVVAAPPPPPNVGGVAESPDVMALSHAAGPSDTRDAVYALGSAGLALLAAGGAGGWCMRRRRAAPETANANGVRRRPRG